MARLDQRSVDAEAYRGWYKTQRWRNLRAAQLRSHPLCAMCEEDGRVTAATVCDHVRPHKGDATLFWSGPFQSLCKLHHDATKQRAEARGYEPGSDASGQPRDPAHHWNT